MMRKIQSRSHYLH